MPTIPYKLDGIRIPGTTTIIDCVGWNKRFLMAWAWRKGTEGEDYRDVSKRAATAGTIAHYMIECDLRGTLPDLAQYPADLVALATQAFTNYLEWKALMNFQVISLEEHLVCKEYRYGLTPDCICTINNKISLFDWKTSSGLYPEMLLQLAAYIHGWNENKPDQQIVNGAYLLRIDSESASFHFHHWGSLRIAWEAFVHARELYDYQAKLKKFV